MSIKNPVEYKINFLVITKQFPQGIRELREHEVSLLEMNEENSFVP
jgi:hypothetical protein